MMHCPGITHVLPRYQRGTESGWWYNDSLLNRMEREHTVISRRAAKHNRAGFTALWRPLLGMLLVTCILLLLCYAGLEYILLPRLESKLIYAVRRELALPEDAEVEVLLGNILATLSGNLPAFHVNSSTAVIDEYRFQGLRFDASHVRFNIRRIIRGDKAEILSVGSAQLVLLMSTNELKSQLLPILAEEGLENVTIDFKSDSATVTADGKLKVTARGQFYLTDEKSVGFKLTQVELDKLNITVSNLTLLVDDVIPALDLGGMFARVVIDELHVDEHFLEITAHTEDLALDQLTDEVVDVF